MIPLLLASLLVVQAAQSIPMAGAPRSDDGAEKPQTGDSHCGILALFYLARLLDRPLSLDAIESSPSFSGSRSGCSMADLKQAATGFGITLEGIQLDKRERLWDRPMILFQRSPNHGHFLVTRPVGHSGNLVQVFDGVQPTAIVDLERLSNQRSWTGLALVPVSSIHWFDRTEAVLVVVAMIALLSVPRFRRTRVAP